MRIGPKGTIKVLAGDESAADEQGAGRRAPDPADWMKEAIRHRCEGEDGCARPCNIVFWQSAYRKVVEHLSEDVSREHGGFLLGHEIDSGESTLPTVFVKYAVPAK